jgi:hypothetical protein
MFPTADVRLDPLEAPAGMSPHRSCSMGIHPITAIAPVKTTSFGQQFNRDLPAATSDAR